jgi:UDP-N-acetylmuramate--alanine ligase
MVSSAQLASRISAAGGRAIFLPTFEEIVGTLRKMACEGDLIVTMGAGNVWQIGRELLANPGLRIAG